MLLVLIKYVNVAVAVILALRLASLQIFSLYKVFAVFLLYDLSISVAYVTIPWRLVHDQYGIDYRAVWLAERPVAWALWVLVVFAVLRGLMNRHRGILKATRRIFLLCLAAAVILALVSARIEFAVSAGSAGLHPLSRLGVAVQQGLIVERAVLTTALVLLAGMLTFLLWFPVEVTRNVAFLCAGLLVYFAAAAGLMFARGIWSVGSTLGISIALYLIQTGCLLVWLKYINRAGENQQVRPGHSWKPELQDRMVEQLEALNKALQRSREESEISAPR